MSLFNVVLTKNAKKEIAKLDKHIAKRIQKKINFFVNSGEPLAFAESLTKPADAHYRWRVGDYRILFDFEHQSNTIVILKIQHRREVYKS